jgi:hypothetical protein
MEATNLPKIDKRKSIATLITKDEHSVVLATAKEFLSADRFNFVVTEDTVKQAKDSMAELNKIDKEHKALVKEKVDQESQDIVLFKANGAEISRMIQDTRETLDKGVSTFTTQAKEAHKNALTYALTVAYDTNEIRPEFKDFSMLDGILSTAKFTKADDKTLIKKYTDLIDGYVETAKGKQAQADIEELKKQKEIDDKANEKAQQMLQEQNAKTVTTVLEHSQNQEPQIDVPECSTAVPESVPYPEQRVPFVPTKSMPYQSQPEQKPIAKDGNSVYSVSILYKIEAKANIHCDAIENKIRNMMIKAGFESDLNINVVEVK